jgi:hypothetical protein
MNEAQSLYGLVVAGPSPVLADRIAHAIAVEALDDPEWRALYDGVIDSGSGHPEEIPVLLKPPAGPAGLEATRFLLTLDPAQAVEPLLERAQSLSFPAEAGSWDDVVAAAVGLQLWHAALGTEDLMQAASMGPAAVRSLAAVIARACGAPVSGAGPGAVADPAFECTRVQATISFAQDWSFLQVGPGRDTTVLQAAAFDLSYLSPARTATGEAACRLLRATREHPAA